MSITILNFFQKTVKSRQDLPACFERKKKMNEKVALAPAYRSKSSSCKALYSRRAAELST